MICAKEELSLVTKKYIVQFNIKDNNFDLGERRVYVTKDESLAKNNIGKEDNLLNFYNLYSDKWITYNWTDIAMYTYPNYDMLVTQNEEDSHFYESILDIITDNPKVKDANEKILLSIQELKDIFYNTVEEAKKIKNISQDIIDRHRDLFLSEFFSGQNAYTKNKLLFNLIFNLNIENYKNKNYDLDNIVKTYFEVLDYYSNIAKNDLKEEKDQLDEEEMIAEIESIEEILNDSVIGLKDKCNEIVRTVKEDNYNLEHGIIDMLEDWPPILFPTPVFICDNTDNDTLMQENIWLFTDVQPDEN